MLFCIRARRRGRKARRILPMEASMNSGGPRNYLIPTVPGSRLQAHHDLVIVLVTFMLMYILLVDKERLLPKSLQVRNRYGYCMYSYVPYTDPFRVKTRAFALAWGLMYNESMNSRERVNMCNNIKDLNISAILSTRYVSDIIHVPTEYIRSNALESQAEKEVHPRWGPKARFCFRLGH